MATLPEPQSLTTLPNEIQNEIINLLDNFNWLVLRTTNKHFREMISFTPSDLVKAEEAPFPREKDLYGCFDCLRLRRAAHFADNMRNRKQRKGGSYASGRFCLDCGLNPLPRTTR